MGRAGQGSSSSSRSTSSSHRVSSSSSSGHRLHSGRSRAGQGSSSGGFDVGDLAGAMLNGGRRGYGYGSYGMTSRSIPNMPWWVMLLIVVVIAGGVIFAYYDAKPRSTIQRTKIEGVEAFTSKCITDEIGWFSNTGAAGSNLKRFYQETGVQPYIYLKAYDSALTTDAAKEEWANKYFDDKGYSDNALLFIYFAEQNVDGDVGYMNVAYGSNAATIFDDEAMNIFWTYTDKHWYSDVSTDELFVKIFDDTAKAIMSTSKTGSDIIFIVVAAILVLGILAGVIFVIIVKAKAKAAEDERAKEILNAPIGDMISGGGSRK